MSRNTGAPTNCPCGSGLAYALCCKRWHHGEQRLGAPNAQVLMRSRYSAYVLDELAYILDTWHPDTWPRALEPNPPGLIWLGLEIRRYTVLAADRASVEFVARNRFNGRATRLHETSRFVQEQERWYYVDGDLR